MLALIWSSGGIRMEGDTLPVGHMAFRHPLPIQHTSVFCFSLVTGCGITFSSPWTNQANILVTRNPR